MPLERACRLPLRRALVGAAAIASPLRSSGGRVRVSRPPLGGARVRSGGSARRSYPSDGNAQQQQQQQRQRQRGGGRRDEMRRRWLS
mmetsp:Transcript_30933/g.92049  ORF Transcript_30933/g.92049 Transcript_30933/m.92049 type:complete len:87 (-) Transcript_30933:284-544(-)